MAAGPPAEGGRAAADGRPRDPGRRGPATDRPDGTRADYAHRHERGRADPRLRAGPHRRDVRERRPLHPQRRVRPVARNGRDERHRPRGGRRGTGARRIARPAHLAQRLPAQRHRASSPPACGWACRSPSTSASATTSSTSTPTSTQPPSARPATAISSPSATPSSQLEGGVFLCMGSAVMGPEVYLKALSMARNVAHQEGRQIANFTTAAFDLIPIEGDLASRSPQDQPAILLPPLEDDPRPHRGRRRAKASTSAATTAKPCHTCGRRRYNEGR